MYDILENKSTHKRCPQHKIVKEVGFQGIRSIQNGSTLTALEIHAAQMWWHVKEEDNQYDEEFGKENKVVGVLWANKRDSGLWFAPPEWRECRLGIQLLPILPISEVLFSNVDFVKELVEWTLPALNREGVGEGWKGFVIESDFDHGDEVSFYYRRHEKIWEIMIRRQKDWQDNNTD